MDAPTAAVIGAGIGASVTLISTLLTTFLAGWRQERTEGQKHIWAVEDANSAKLDDALTQMTIKLATALHLMCWVTWLAAKGPARFTEERADGYDREMHLLLPEISSWSSIIAALDIEAFRKISKLVDEIYELDVRIGTASQTDRCKGRCAEPAGGALAGMPTEGTGARASRSEDPS